MTTLDRLYQKGLLSRVKRGRPYFYAAAITHSEFESSRALDAFRAALKASDATAATDLMSTIVDAVQAHRPELLAVLESLSRNRQAAR